MQITPDKIERLKQIKKNRHAFYGGLGELTSDIDFLLSLVDSQVAGDQRYAGNIQMGSDEREDRLLQSLVETPAGERIRMKCGAADLRSVITDILNSLPYVVNAVDAERLADYHKIGNMPAIVKSVDYGAVTLAECVEKTVDRFYYRGRKEGAASMRSACIEKLKALPTDYRDDRRPAMTVDAFKRLAIKELESTSIQEQKS